MSARYKSTGLLGGCGLGVSEKLLDVGNQTSTVGWGEVRTPTGFGNHVDGT